MVVKPLLILAAVLVTVGVQATPPIPPGAPSPARGHPLAPPLPPSLHRRDGDWGGFGRPGWHDPGDPWDNDWHCDRHGFLAQ
jgi:hypothetical protein